MDLTIRVVKWFDERCGKRASWDPRPGRTVVIIGDDPWEIVIPRIFGSHRFFASKTGSSDAIDPIAVPGQALPRFNVLERLRTCRRG